MSLLQRWHENQCCILIIESFSSHIARYNFFPRILSRFAVRKESEWSNERECNVVYNLFEETLNMFCLVNCERTWRIRTVGSRRWWQLVSRVRFFELGQSTRPFSYPFQSISKWLTTDVRHTLREVNQHNLLCRNMLWLNKKEMEFIW